MAKPEIWVVRADKSIASKVEESSFLAIGWFEMGDPRELATKEEFMAKYQFVYQKNAKRSTGAASQLYRFVRDIQKGDLVLTPLSSSREILIGRVTSDYAYDEKAVSVRYPNIRTVKWLKRVSRDKLSPQLRGSVGSIMTLFKISDYLPEVEHLLDDRSLDGE